MYKEKVKTVAGDTKILVCTPHDMVFSDIDGTTVSIKSCGATLPAEFVDDCELTIKQNSSASFFQSRPIQTKRGISELKAIRDECGPDVIVVGSILSSIAYQDVFNAIPQDTRSGSWEQKARRCDKFGKLPQFKVVTYDDDPSNTVSCLLHDMSEAKEKLVTAIKELATKDSAKRRGVLVKMAENLDRLDGIQESIIKAVKDKIKIFEEIRADIKKLPI